MNLNPQYIAVVNAGSATLKFSLLKGEATVLTALIERLGTVRTGESTATIRNADGSVAYEGAIPAAHHHAEALIWLFDWLKQKRPGLRPAAVGHRVVHGGDALIAPGRITSEVIGQIEALTLSRLARSGGSGLDALVFIGGIGEHAASVQARICELSGWLGITIDPNANDCSRTVLHRDDSRVRVLVVSTDEKRLIARHVRQVLDVPSGSA